MIAIQVTLLLFGPTLFGLLAVWVCERVRRKRQQRAAEAAAARREARDWADQQMRARVPRARWPYEPTLPRQSHVPPRPMPAPAAPRRVAAESSPSPAAPAAPAADSYVPPFHLHSAGHVDPPIFKSGGGGDFGGGGASDSWGSSSSDSSSSSSDSGSSGGGSE